MSKCSASQDLDAGDVAVRPGRVHPTERQAMIVDLVRDEDDAIVRAGHIHFEDEIVQVHVINGAPPLLGLHEVGHGREAYEPLRVGRVQVVLHGDTRDEQVAVQLDPGPFQAHGARRCLAGWGAECTRLDYPRSLCESDECDEATPHTYWSHSRHLGFRFECAD